MLKTLRLTMLMGLWLAAVCAACQATPATLPAPLTATVPLQAATMTPAPATPSPASSPALTPTVHLLPTRQQQPEAVTKAIADLAARLKIEAAAIEVVSVTSDDFPAQDLGCLSPSAKGQPVLPAFVTGLAIRLRASGRLYEYHAHGGELAFCSPVLP